MRLKRSVLALLTAIVLPIAACDSKSGEASKSGAAPVSSKPDASGRCTHQIKQEKCPFCKPSLVESDGFCGEHGVAEALCVQCRPYLKAAFRAKGDWCKEHDAPDSQCMVCHPELKGKIRPGEHGTPAAAAGSAAAGNCEHSIAQAKCPFCTPSLIESDGFCKEHDIAEALCVKCRPYLEAAFKAKGDWCTEHGTPESQCAECNPELKNKQKAKS